MSKRFWSETGGAGGAGATWGVKSRNLGGGRRKVSIAVPKSYPVRRRTPAGRGVMSGGRWPVTRMQGMRARTGGFTGIERKFYDSSLVGGALTAPAAANGAEHDPSTTICLNTIIQGDGEENRDGRVASIQSTFVKGTVSCVKQINQTALDNGTKIYIALVLDTQTNGAQLNSEDVFKNESGDGKLAASPMRNMQFTQRFRVLDTFEAVLESPDASYDGTNVEQAGLVQPFTLSSNIQFRTQYSGTTETVANITDNSLHIIAYCNDVDLVPLINYNARVRFVG